MTTITGTVKEFKNMFKLIMCGSKYPLFQTVILKISDDIISIDSMDSTMAVIAHQQYNNFKIEGNNDIPIDTISIYEAIKLFDLNQILKLTYEDNKIILESDLSDKKDKILIPTINIDEISNKSKIEFSNNFVIINNNKMEFDAHVEINTSYIQNQIKIGNYVGNMYHEYIIDINENKLTLIVGDPTNYETSSITEIEVIGNGIAHSSYAHGYDDIFNALNGNVIIHINDKKPMLISQITDEYTVQFLIAPIIHQDDMSE